MNKKPKFNIFQMSAIAVVFALFIRLSIDVLIFKDGYYFGEDPDTFWRLGLSWIWSRKPFFIFGYWVPLQFWFVGSTFFLLRIFADSSSVLVPVVWNHIFLLGSLSILFLLTNKQGGYLSAIVAVLIATTMTTDIWTTFSGLVEPTVIFCGLLISYAIQMYYDAVESPKRGKYLYIMAAGAATASAAHYVGWYFSIFVSIFLLFLIFSGLRSPTQISERIKPLSLSLLIVVGFPISWMLANWIKFGDPLRFLDQAKSYHYWYLPIGLLDKLRSIPMMLWKAEPYLTSLFLISFSISIVKRAKNLIYLIPGIVYYLLLLFSGFMTYGVPDMHDRYILYCAWLFVPSIAILIANLISVRNNVTKIIGTAIITMLGLSGILRSYNYSNYMDDQAREVARFIDNQIDNSDDELNIIVEDHTCLFPMAGIANSISRPDMTELVGSNWLSDFTSSQSEISPSLDMAVLINPITINAFSSELYPILNTGDYLVTIPVSDNTVEMQGVNLPNQWIAIREDQFLYTSDVGTIYFAFQEPPSKIGEYVGIETTMRTKPNDCYILSANLEDWYQQPEFPWTLHQQLVVNDVVIWSHDVSGGGDCHQALNHYIQPTSNHLHIQIRTVVRSDPSTPIDWSNASLTGIRNLNLSTCELETSTKVIIE